MRAIDGDAVKHRIWDIAEGWKARGRNYEGLLLESVVEQIVDTQSTLPQPSNEPMTLEYREYRCAECGHGWMEDCDATDYPNYCPGCGNELRRPPEGEEDT